MTIEEFEQEVVRWMAENTDWRYGQTWFNVLYELRPHLSEQIRATPLDPFGDDRILTDARKWLAEHWDDPIPEGFVKPRPEDILRNAFKRAWG